MRTTTASDRTRRSSTARSRRFALRGRNTNSRMRQCPGVTAGGTSDITGTSSSGLDQQLLGTNSTEQPRLDIRFLIKYRARRRVIAEARRARSTVAARSELVNHPPGHGHFTVGAQVGASDSPKSETRPWQHRLGRRQLRARSQPDTVRWPDLG